MASWLEAEGTSEGTDLTSSSIQGLTKQLNRRKRKRSKTGQVEVDGADELEAASDQAAAAAAPAAGAAAAAAPAAAAAAAPAAAAAAAAGSDDDEDDEDDEIAWEAGDEADADPGWEDTVLPASPAPKRRRQQAGDDVVDLSIDDDEDNEGAGATAANGRALAPGAVFHSREIKVQPPGKCRFVGHAGRCTSSDEFQRFLSMIKSDPAYQDADSHTCAFRYHKLDSQGARQRSKGKARLIENSKDGDEKGAGTKLLDVLKQADAVGVVVIVSRWFGGTNLGKARFSYMVKAGCSVLAKVGYTNEAIGDGASEQHARTVSEAHLAQGMLSGFLGHAILHHAEAMVPARQDGVLNTVRQIPSYRRTVRSFFEC
jgi:putative IMPACT (imprinted ancient) family translation regulator